MFIEDDGSTSTSSNSTNQKKTTEFKEASEEDLEKTNIYHWEQEHQEDNPDMDEQI